MKRMKNKLAVMAAGVFLCMSGLAHAGLIVHTSPFINDASQTNFMDFDSSGSLVGVYLNSYLQNGIIIHEAVGNVYLMNTMNNGSLNYQASTTNFADKFGYTSIKMENGSSFGAIGMDLVMTGDPNYEKAWVVLKGGSEIAHGVTTSGYLGFEGADFDEIRLKAPAVYVLNHPPYPNVYGDYYNGIGIDNIRVAQAGIIPDTPNQNVPEPAPLALLGIGCLAVGYHQRRKNKNTVPLLNA